MEFKRFEKNVPFTIEVDGITYFFTGFLMPSENIIIRIRPVTGWIRENGLISNEGAVYVPRYEEKKGK